MFTVLFVVGRTVVGVRVTRRDARGVGGEVEHAIRVVIGEAVDGGTEVERVRSPSLVEGAPPPNAT